MKFPAISDYHLGLLLVSASAVAWSTAGLFTRLVAYDAATLVVWRGVFGALGILAIMVLISRRSPVAEFRALGWPGVVFAVVAAAGMVMFIVSLRHTTVAHVAVIFATAPLLAAGLGWVVLRERSGASALVASVVALCGVVVMVGFGTEGGLSGDLLAFGMTLAVAAMMILARRYPGMPVLPAACLSAVVSALACLPFSDPFAVAGGDVAILALFGLMNAAIGMALFVLGARLLPPVETALISALDAPLSPLWVWLVFGESPSLWTSAGGLIVFLAVGTHMVRSQARPVQA